MKLPQFTLRDLIWLVLVVAMGLGWWLQSRGLMQTNAALFKQNNMLYREIHRDLWLFRANTLRTIYESNIESASAGPMMGFESMNLMAELLQSLPEVLSGSPITNQCDDLAHAHEPVRAAEGKSMKCYACNADATRSCPSCGRFCCERHAGAWRCALCTRQNTMGVIIGAMMLAAFLLFIAWYQSR
jgi:hypothetical protein